MKKCWPLLLLGFVIATHAYAWNSNGHRIVAQIAYDQLTRVERAEFNEINHHFRGRYLNFINAAVWADQIRKFANKKYDSWHYIDLPNTQAFASNRIAPQNVIWAINTNQQLLSDPKSSLSRKAFSLRMLIHLVGDIHQPLHCITHYDAKFPRGDYGGNLYLIKVAGVTINLHRYWDEEVARWGYHYLSNRQIRKIASQLEQQYPPSYFSNSLQQHSPSEWAKQSYQLAKTVAYSIAYGETPDAVYQQQANRVVAQQITLAGYRLAQLLQRTH